VIYLFTDFGREGPYVGQMHVILAQQAPGIPVIDLMHDAPAHDPRASAYLLAALSPDFPEGSVCCAVVDPGVGTSRPPVAIEADRRWYVGPGNGLFEMICRRAKTCSQYEILWTPETLSTSFHGRDLFAPVAARIVSSGDLPTGWLTPLAEAAPGADWPDDLPEIVYIDRFGNLMTGLRTSALASDAVLTCGGHEIRSASVFGEASAGTAFWYGNSNGLIEVAVPNASATALLGAAVGGGIGVSEAH